MQSLLHLHAIKITLVKIFILYGVENRVGGGGWNAYMHPSILKNADRDRANFTETSTHLAGNEQILQIISSLQRFKAEKSCFK